jgi:hypothetical protein
MNACRRAITLAIIGMAGLVGLGVGVAAADQFGATGTGAVVVTANSGTDNGFGWD